ncbi:MAG: hypothetical protein F6J98_18995 [Moorea sp. SIO4G2]|nr:MULTISPECIES: hypothetical protein [Moorena]NEO13465.1 hypothetical protein [Moorena sp. SIO3E8]NEO62406.1 hypothetical protein [Moorena sp. SIO4G2]NEQ01788.1 hypothetical protein [Moorena sp. SIO3F7]
MLKSKGWVGRTAPDSRLPTPDSRLPTPDSLKPTSSKPLTELKTARVS